MTATQTESGVAFGFAGFSPDDLLDEPTVAAALRTTPRTVKRMVERGELPAPVMLAGRRCWNVGRVRQWIDRLSQEAEEKEKEAQEIDEAIRRHIKQKNAVL